MPPIPTGGDTRRSRLRLAGLLVVGMLSLLVLTGCAEANDQWQRLGLPEPASDRSEPVEELWIGSWIAAMIIGAFVWGLILYASFRFRRRSPGEVPPQTRYNLPIEVLYTFAPLIVVAVLFFFTVQKIDEVTAVVENPDHEITVTGQRWSWAAPAQGRPEGARGPPGRWHRTLQSAGRRAASPRCAVLRYDPRPR